MSSVEAELERRHAMRLALVRWAEAHHNLMAARDGLVRDAVTAGISKTEVAKLVGIHRSYVYDLLAKTGSLTESPLSALFPKDHNDHTNISHGQPGH